MTPSPDSDWHLQDWLRHFGKKQAALVNELGWGKGRAHYVWHGKIPYTREVVNEISAWLGIEPYELLMRPKDALALRTLRETAAAIVADRPEAPPGRPAQIRRAESGT